MCREKRPQRIGTLSSQGVGSKSTIQETRMRLVLACLALTFALWTTSSWVEGFDDAKEAVAAMEENPEELLQWALNHSDADALQSMAQDAREGKEAAIRRMKEIREAMEVISKQVPSDADEMQSFIHVLKDGTSGSQQKVDALEGLKFLMESIDNANDFAKMGGIEVLYDELNSKNSKIAFSAAHALGIGAANNPEFQLMVIDRRPDTLQTLARMAVSDDQALQKKCLYALSALVRNREEIQNVFFVGGGLSALRSVLQSTTTGNQIKLRAMQLITDLLIEVHQRGGLNKEFRVLLEDVICPAVELLPTSNDAAMEDVLRALEIIHEVGGRQILQSKGASCKALDTVRAVKESTARTLSSRSSQEYNHEVREAADEDSGAAFMQGLLAQLSQLEKVFEKKSGMDEL